MKRRDLNSSDLTIDDLTTLRRVHRFPQAVIARELGHSVYWLCSRELEYVATTPEERTQIQQALERLQAKGRGRG